MSGYTPVFGTIYQGTLCGKWPDAAVWASILPLCDRTGRIDYTPEAIAALTGWPLDLLRQGLEGLCQPDPHSRSDAEDGCRLQLIDPARSWGWVVVNHTKYREKARLMGRESARIATGENRRRMAARRATPDDPREPPPTHPHTQTHTQTKKEDCAPSGRARELDAEALAEVCQLDLKRMTPAERGRFNKALKGIRSVGASPDSIRARAVVYRRLFADCSLTPTGLEANWGKCDPSPPLPAADQAKADATRRIVEASLAADRKRLA